MIKVYAKSYGLNVAAVDSQVFMDLIQLINQLYTSDDKMFYQKKHLKFTEQVSK